MRYTLTMNQREVREACRRAVIEQMERKEIPRPEVDFSVQVHLKSTGNAIVEITPTGYPTEEASP